MAYEKHDTHTSVITQKPRRMAPGFVYRVPEQSIQSKHR